MTVIEATRELGKAIQADERYIKLAAATKANEADDTLNNLISKLNLIQMSYQHEAENGADEETMNGYDKQFRELYDEIMVNENMKNYENARQDVDDMMNYVMQLLSMVVNGADPETCDPAAQQSGCSGSCSTCGGCG